MDFTPKGHVGADTEEFFRSKTRESRIRLLKLHSTRKHGFPAKIMVTKCCFFRRFMLILWHVAGDLFYALIGTTKQRWRLGGGLVNESIFAGVVAAWENCLRDLVGRRGHLISVVNDIRNIDTVLADPDYEMVFVGMDGADDETIEICRQLRARRGLKPLAILGCGDAPGHDKIQAFLSAGIDDCLTDPQDHAELEFRLALAESRVSGRAVSDAAQGPGIGQCRKDDSFDVCAERFFPQQLGRKGARCRSVPGRYAGI